MDPERERCPACKGKGVFYPLSSWPSDCDDCFGTGEIDCTTEVWKAYPSIPAYTVSHWGRMAFAGSLLSGKIHKSSGRPYYVVCGKVVYMHHAVLETWVGPRPKGKHALHKDDDPLNNRLSNLYWGTPVENLEDRRRNKPGWSEPRAKLTEEQVREIRRQDAASTNALAKEYGVSHSTMRKILRRETWKNVG